MHPPGTEWVVATMLGLLAHGRDVGSGALHLGDDLVGVIEQMLTSSVQSDPTAEAIEQSAVQVHFK